MANQDSPLWERLGMDHALVLLGPHLIWQRHSSLGCLLYLQNNKQLRGIKPFEW